MVSEQAYRKWFQKFCSEFESLENARHSGKSCVTGDNELQVVITVDLSQTCHQFDMKYCVITETTSVVIAFTSPQALAFQLHTRR